MNVIEIIKKRGIGFIINMVVILIAVIGFILYCVSARDRSGMTETSVSALVIILYVIGIGMSTATLFFNNDLTKIMTAVVYFAVLGFWAQSQAGYIVNVFMGTDGNVFSGAYIACVVMTAVAMILSCLTILKPKKQPEPESKPEPEAKSEPESESA
jgi:ABC-type multidrug transport system permease subunit